MGCINHFTFNYNSSDEYIVDIQNNTICIPCGIKGAHNTYNLNTGLVICKYICNSGQSIIYTSKNTPFKRVISKTKKHIIFYNDSSIYLYTNNSTRRKFHCLYKTDSNSTDRCIKVMFCYDETYISCMFAHTIMTIDLSNILCLSHILVNQLVWFNDIIPCCNGKGVVFKTDHNYIALYNFGIRLKIFKSSRNNDIQFDKITWHPTKQHVMVVLSHTIIIMNATTYDILVRFVYSTDWIITSAVYSPCGKYIAVYTGFDIYIYCTSTYYKVLHIINDVYFFSGLSFDLSGTTLILHSCMRAATMRIKPHSCIYRTSDFYLYGPAYRHLITLIFTLFDRITGYITFPCDMLRSILSYLYTANNNVC